MCGDKRKRLGNGCMKRNGILEYMCREKPKETLLRLCKGKYKTKKRIEKEGTKKVEGGWFGTNKGKKRVTRLKRGTDSVK